MAQIFTISDGTTTVDLLSATGPYYLGVYETGINQWKSGGIYTDSALSEGSIPIFRQFDTFEEKLTLHIAGDTQDDVIDNLRTLIMLLESGVEYFISGLGNQAYMTLKGDTETNARYGVIVGYKIETLPGPFAGTFVTGAKTDNNITIDALYSEVELVLRRGIWLEAVPGTMTRAYIDTQTTYNSITSGFSSSNSLRAYASNYRHTSNITHIYKDDGGSFSSNLISASLPYNLFPNSPATNDALYIGSDTSLTDSGPFFNLVFNIGTAGDSSWVIVGEYWNGSSWQSGIPLHNETNAFEIAGIGLASWAGISNWATTSVNGVTGYWIRFRVTTAGSTIPTQQTRNIYSVNVPYIDIQSTGLAGDIDPISRVEIIRADTASNNKIVIGRRIYSRGSNFTPYLNFSDDQNPSGVTITTNLFSFGNDSLSPTGRSLSRIIGGSFGNASITLSSALASHYIGRYRCFARVRRSGGAQGAVLGMFSVSSSAGGSVFYPEVELNVSLTDNMEVLDFGIIEIPQSFSKSDTISYDVELSVYLKDTTASGAITGYLYDIILIPSDECILEIDASLLSPNSFTSSPTLIMDKLTSPEEPLDAHVNDTATGGAVYKTIYGGSDAIYLAKERHRLHFFGYQRTIANNIYFNQAQYFDLYSVIVYKMNRYLLPRGNS